MNVLKSVLAATAAILALLLVRTVSEWLAGHIPPGVMLAIAAVMFLGMCYWLLRQGQDEVGAGDEQCRQ